MEYTPTVEEQKEEQAWVEKMMSYGFTRQEAVASLYEEDNCGQEVGIY